MWTILLIFNVLFAFIAEKNYKRNKFKCKLFLTLIIITNAIIVGLRDIGVGIDTMVYIAMYFGKATEISNISGFLHTDSTFDKGYLLLALITKLFSNEASSLMFVTELFVITFIILGLYQYKKTINCSIFLFMVLFCLIYCEHTFNIMRQFCAMSILFYGYSLFMQKKYLPYFACQITSYFFHSSSIIFILVPLCSIISQKEYNLKVFYLFSIVLFGIAGIFAYNYIIPLIEATGVLKVEYFDRYGAAQKVGTFSIRALIYVMLELWICYIMYKRKNIKNSNLYFFMTLCMLTFLFTETLYVSEFFFRLSYYFGIILCLYISGLYKIKDNAISCLLYIYFVFVVQGSIYLYDDKTMENGNLVYKSQILGIE